MKITQISLSQYGSKPEGSFILYDPDTTLNVKLQEEDCLRIMALCLEIFERRQAALANRVRDMRPAQLPAPGVVEGEFREVSDLDDGIPF